MLLFTLFSLTVANFASTNPNSKTYSEAPPSSGTLANNVDPTSYKCNVLKGTNKIRNRQGLPDLIGDTRLDDAAMKHCKVMAASKKLDHVVGNEAKPHERIANAGYDWQGVAENIYTENGYGKESTASNGDRAVNAWDDSPGHHANIVGKYSHHGVASCVADNGAIYWSQEFGNGDNDKSKQYDCSEKGSYSPPTDNTLSENEIKVAYAPPPATENTRSENETKNPPKTTYKAAPPPPTDKTLSENKTKEPPATTYGTQDVQSTSTKKPCVKTKKGKKSKLRKRSVVTVRKVRK